MIQNSMMAWLVSTGPMNVKRENDCTDSFTTIKKKEPSGLITEGIKWEMWFWSHFLGRSSPVGASPGQGVNMPLECLGLLSQSEFENEYFQADFLLFSPWYWFFKKTIPSIKVMYMCFYWRSTSGKEKSSMMLVF